ncbi:MAG: nuclear transport factor 2 family protein [Proteobacteria bacterium]|nr:nuclear transport factor 2 family protein [Pseudomonadota bacterium]
MIKNKTDIATAYYEAMSNKNIDFIEKQVHPNVYFIGPLAEFTGKEKYLDSVRKFFNLFNSLKVREKFGAEDQAIIVYDVHCPDPIGILRAVALLNFKDNLISRIELFYDTRLLEKKGQEIFSNS